jgi:mRNA interferase HicA
VICDNETRETQDQSPRIGTHNAGRVHAVSPGRRIGDGADLRVNDKEVTNLMKYSELKQILKQNGCHKDSEGANHEIWYSSITNNKFPVGRHDREDVPKGTLNAILKQSGIKE